MFIPGELIALYAMQQEREFMTFCEYQCKRRKNLPSRDQYILARCIAYEIENPAPTLWYRTFLAKSLKFIFRL